MPWRPSRSCWSFGGSRRRKCNLLRQAGRLGVSSHTRDLEEAGRNRKFRGHPPRGRMVVVSSHHITQFTRAWQGNQPAGQLFSSPIASCRPVVATTRSLQPLLYEMRDPDRAITGGPPEWFDTRAQRNSARVAEVGLEAQQFLRRYSAVRAGSRGPLMWALRGGLTASAPNRYFDSAVDSRAPSQALHHTSRAALPRSFTTKLVFHDSSSPASLVAPRRPAAERATRVAKPLSAQPCPTWFTIAAARRHRFREQARWGSSPTLT